MGAITTTTNAAPLQYPANSRIERDPVSGRLFCLIISSTGSLDLYSSNNKGGTWTFEVTKVRANVQEISRLCIDNFGQIHVAYRCNESSQDTLYYQRLETRYGTATWTGSELGFFAAANGGVAGAVFTGLDINCAIANPYTSYVMVAACIGGNQMAIWPITLSPAGTGVPQVNYSTLGPYAQWTGPGGVATGHQTPSIEFYHPGDDRSGIVGQPVNFAFFWGRDAQFLTNGIWNGHGWTTQSNVWTVFGPGLAQCNSSRTTWDGTAYHISAWPGTGASTVDVWQRNYLGTVINKLTTPVHPQGTVRNCDVVYDPPTENFRVFAVGTSTGVLYYIDYTRGTATWSSWTQVVATAILGTNADNWSVRRSTYGDAQYDIIAAHAGSPNTLVSYHQVVSYPPTGPTWSTYMGANGKAADVAAILYLVWDFHDPDPADTQSAYAISRQIGAGALNYWRASDSTWQVAEVQNTSSSNVLPLPAAWASSSDANYTFKVKVWDSSSTASAYSAPFVVVPSALVVPTITAPTPSLVIGQASQAVTWTDSEQGSFRSRIFTDNGATLNANPYFETDTSNWTAFGTGTVLSQSAVQFHQGANSMKVLPNGVNTGAGAQGEELTVAPGSSYYCQTWAWSTSGDANFRLTVRWYDASHTRVAEDYIPSPLSATTWTYAGGVFTPPRADIVYMRLIVTSNSVLAGANFYYVDELQVTSLAAPVYDSTFQNGNTALTWTPTYTLQNGAGYIFALDITNLEGLPSVASTRRTTVQYTAGGLPTIVPTPTPASGYISVAITNPTSGLVTFVNANTPVSASTGSLGPLTLPTGMVADDLMLTYTTIRNSGTGTPNTPAGWAVLAASANAVLFGKLYVPATDLTGPTITYTGGAAGQDVIAAMAAFRGASLTISGVATLLNGAAQNVTTPALSVTLAKQLVMALGWKQEAWTSVALLGTGSMSLVSSKLSSAGTGSSQVWDYVIQTAAASIAGSSFVVTGGTSQISRGLVVSLDVKPTFNYQDLYRRVVGDGTTGIRIATQLAAGATYQDYTAISGTPYEYRSQVFAQNGTSSFSAWTP